MRSDEFMEEALRLYPEKNRNLLHAALGLCTESAEVADLVKKNMYYGKVYNRDQVVDELGDILNYVALALHHVDSDFEEAMHKNIIKMNIRYPNGFNADDAINRNKEEEQLAFEGTDE